ncbi:MAG: phage capsid protein [Dehalococcoidia bacterium]
MATAVVSGFLDINNLGSAFDDLALKIYGGMVLGAYNQKQTTDGRHVQRSISSGKSAQFPATGLATAAFHTRGTEVDFQQVNSAEHVIVIQDRLLSAIFIDKLDEAKSHFDIRREYAKQQGEALANQADLRVLMAFVAASRESTPIVTGLPGGDRITGATIGTDASVLKAGIYDAAEDLDEHNVPDDGRYLWLAPAQFYLLLQDGEFLDRDFGGDGNRTGAVMTRAAAFEIIKTNNLPDTDEQSDGDFPTNLQLDYQATVAVAGHSSAVGSVTLMSLEFEQEYDASRQGTELIAGYAKGFDFLRPEAAVELATS